MPPAAAKTAGGGDGKGKDKSKGKGRADSKGKGTHDAGGKGKRDAKGKGKRDDRGKGDPSAPREAGQAAAPPQHPGRPEAEHVAVAGLVSMTGAAPDAARAALQACGGDENDAAAALLTQPAPAVRSPAGAPGDLLSSLFAYQPPPSPPEADTDDDDDGGRRGSGPSHGGKKVALDRHGLPLNNRGKGKSKGKGKGDGAWADGIGAEDVEDSALLRQVRPVIHPL